MKNSNRLTLRLQIRPFKNALFQFDDFPFKGLLSDGLIKEINQFRSTVLTPLATARHPVGFQAKEHSKK